MLISLSLSIFLSLFIVVFAPEEYLGCVTVVELYELLHGGWLTISDRTASLAYQSCCFQECEESTGRLLLPGNADGVTVVQDI